MAEEEASSGAIGAADAAIIFGANTSATDAAFAKIDNQLAALEKKGKAATIKVMAVFEPANLGAFQAKAQAQLDAMPFAISVLPKLPSGWKDVIQAQLNTGAFYVNVQPRVGGGGTVPPVAPVPTAGGVWNPNWTTAGTSGPRMMASQGGNRTGASGFRFNSDTPSSASTSDPFSAARAAEEERVINRVAADNAQRSANANIRRNSGEIIRLRGGKQFGDTIIPNISAMPLSYRTGMIAGSGADPSVIAAQRQAVNAINTQQLSTMQWSGLGRTRQQELLRAGISARTDINWGANPQAAAALASAEADAAARTAQQAARAAAQAEAVRRTQLRVMPAAYAQNSLFDIERGRIANSALATGATIGPAPLGAMASLSAAYGRRSAISPIEMKRQMQLQNDARREFFAGQTLMRSFLLPGVVAGGASLYMNAQLESEMGRIQGLTQTNKGEIGRERQQLLEQSLKGPTSALDLAGGLYEISSAGYKGRAGKTVLDATSMGSMAGLGSNQQLGGLTTSILSAYGRRPEDSQKVIDTLTQMVVFGKGEASQYSGALGKVVTTAAMAGVGLPEVAANLATMSRVGINPDTGATALNQLLMHIQAPTPAAKKVMDSIGTSPDELRSSLRDNGLLKTLEDLKQKGGNRIDIFDTLFGNVRGLKSFLATAGTQMETYKEALNQMDHAHGSTKNALEAMSGTFEFQWGRMANAVKKGVYDIAGNSMPQLTKMVEGMADTLPRRLERIGYGVQTVANTPVGSGVGAIAGGAALSLAMAGPAFHLSALYKDAKVTGALGKLLSVRNAPVAGLAALAAYRFADTQMGDGTRTDAMLNGLENPESPGIAGAAVNAAILGTLGFQTFRGANTLAGRLSPMLASRFPAAFATSMPAGVYGPAAPIGLGGFALNGAAAAPVVAGLGMAGGAIVGAGAMLGAAYYQEMGREINDREVYTGNVKGSTEAAIGLFDRAGRGARGNEVLTESLDKVREKFLLARDDASKYGSVISDLNKVRLKVMSGAIKMDPVSKQRFITEVGQIVNQIEATKIQIGIKPDTSWEGFKKDVSSWFSGIGEGIVDAFTRENFGDESGRSRTGAIVVRRADTSGSDVFTAPGALTPAQQAALVRSPGQVFAGLTGLKVKDGEDLTARIGGWDSKNDTAYGGLNAAMARMAKDPARFQKQLGAPIYNAMQEKFQEMREDRKRDEANRPGSSDNADAANIQKNLNEANALRADIARMQGQQDSIGKEKAGYDAYAGSLDGILGRLREFGERTEAGRIRSQMFKKDQDGVADSFKNGAIAIGSYLDQMERMQTGQGTLKSLFGDMQGALVEKGLDPSILDPDIKRMQEVMPFAKSMKDLQGKGLNMGQNLAQQAASKSDALQQTMNDLTASIKALNDTISGLESNGGLGTTGSAVAQAITGTATPFNGQSPQWLRDMESKAGTTMGNNCAIELTKQLGAKGFNVGALSADSVNPRMKASFDSEGRLRPGTIVRWPPGRAGYKDGHYASIGSDAMHFTEANYRGPRGKGYISKDRDIDYAKLRQQVASGQALIFDPTMGKQYGGLTPFPVPAGGWTPFSGVSAGASGKAPKVVNLIPRSGAAISSPGLGFGAMDLPELTTSKITTRANFEVVSAYHGEVAKAIEALPAAPVSGKGKVFPSKQVSATKRAVASGDYVAEKGQWSGNAYDLSSYNRTWLKNSWGDMVERPTPFNSFEWGLQGQLQSSKTQEELARAAAAANAKTPEEYEALLVQYKNASPADLRSAIQIARRATQRTGKALRNYSQNEAIRSTELGRRKQSYLNQNPYDPAASTRWGLYNDKDSAAYYYDNSVKQNMIANEYSASRAATTRDWDDDQYNRRSSLAGTMQGYYGMRSGMTPAAAQELESKVTRDLAIRRKYDPKRNLPFSADYLNRRANQEIDEQDAQAKYRGLGSLESSRRGLRESNNWSTFALASRLGLQNQGLSSRSIANQMAAMEAGNNAADLERNSAYSNDPMGMAAYGRAFKNAMDLSSLRDYSQSIDELNQRTRELSTGFVQVTDRTGLAGRALELMDPDRAGLINGAGDLSKMAEMDAYRRNSAFGYDMAAVGTRSDSQRLGSELGVLRGTRGERFERMRAAAKDANTPFIEGLANQVLDADEQAKADEQSKAALLEQARALQTIKDARKDARGDAQVELATITALTDRQKVEVEVLRKRNDYKKRGLDFTMADEEETRTAAQEAQKAQREQERYQTRVNLFNAGKAGTLAGFGALMAPGDGGALARSKRDEDYRWLSMSMDLQDRGYGANSVEVKMAEKRHKQLAGELGGQNIFEKFLGPVASSIGGAASAAGADALNKGLWGLIGGDVAGMLGMPQVSGMGNVGPASTKSSKGIGAMIGSIFGFAGPLGGAGAGIAGALGDGTIQANNVTVIGGTVTQGGGGPMAAGLTTEQMMANGALGILSAIG